MRSSSETRRAARTALSGNWGSAVLVVLIATLITSAISFAVSMVSTFIQLFTGIGTIISSAESDPAVIAVAATSVIGAFVILFIVSIVGSLCTYFVASNLQAGQAIYYLNLVRGSHSDVSDLFAQFKRGFMKPFGIFWLTYLKMMLWMLIGYLPGCVLIALASVAFLCELPAVGGLCIFFGILLVILGFVLMIIAALRYSMVYYILADNPGVGIRESVRISKELMRGHKADYFILELSFIGWMILSAFTCGIGILFLDPYMCASSAVFYCDLIGRPVVGDMAWFEAMRQNGTYIPGSYTPYGSSQNGYNQNTGAQDGYAPGGYSGSTGAQEAPEATCADTAPETSAPLSENAEIQAQEAPIQAEPQFDEVDISKIGAQENISENAENTENGDNPTQNN